LPCVHGIAVVDTNSDDPWRHDNSGGRSRNPTIQREILARYVLEPGGIRRYQDGILDFFVI